MARQGKARSATNFNMARHALKTIENTQKRMARQAQARRATDFKIARHAQKAINNTQKKIGKQGKARSATNFKIARPATIFTLKLTNREIRGVKHEFPPNKEM